MIESFLKRFFTASAIISAALTSAVFFFLFYFAIPLLENGDLKGLLFSNWEPDNNVYGIYPMLIASLILAVSSLIISFPISLGTSFFIVSIAPPRLRKIMLYIVRLMTGIPTVVYSFAALFLLVPFMRNVLSHGSGLSLLTAMPVVALLIVPTMIIFFVNSLTHVSKQSLLAAQSLGASSVQTILYVMLPQAWPGLLNGILLGFGRAIGDTMASLMLAGNSPSVPHSLTDSARTLTAHIGLVLAFDFDSIEFKSVFLCGLVLYLTTAILMAIFRMITSLSMTSLK